MLQLLSVTICGKLEKLYRKVKIPDHVKNDLSATLAEIFETDPGHPFIFLIDEWDCVVRERRNDTEGLKKYLDFLRTLLKDQSYVALAYMTGILPIKKYGSHSALNMFREYSMTSQGIFASYTGFTAEEVKSLCEKFDMDFESVRQWYDGYAFPSCSSIYSPISVVKALTAHTIDTYWTTTETWEALGEYIALGIDGIHDKVIRLLAGDRIRAETKGFTNDMVSINNADDALTLLIHLGYLAFDAERNEVYVPNTEISTHFSLAIQNKYSDAYSEALKKSDEILDATLKQDGETVAKMLDELIRNTLPRHYDSENSVRDLVRLAYYRCLLRYTIKDEESAGQGFADRIFRPRPMNHTDPAIIMEFKHDRSAGEALRYIDNKNYPNALEDYRGEVLLVGINFSSASRRHSCRIRRITL